MKNMGDLPGHRRRWPLPVALVSGLLLVYGLFPTANAYFTRDPIDIALRLRQGNWGELFDPHHVLYGPLVLAVGRVTQGLGIGDTLGINQALSILAGAAGAGFMFAFLRNLVQDWRIAATAALFVAFCYGTWRYAVEAMPYSPMFLGLAATGWAMERILRRGTMIDVVLLGLGSAIAVSFHQSLVLLLPACLVAIGLMPEGSTSKVRAAAIFLGVWAVLLMPLYALDAWLHRVGSSKDLVALFISNLTTVGPVLGLGQFSLGRSLKALFGLGNLLAGEVFALRFIAARPAWAARLVGLMPAAALPPASYAARGPWQLVAVLGMLVPLAALLALGALYAVRHARRLWAESWRMLMVFLVWTVPIAAFAVWYFPENVHFWTPLLVPLGAVAALVLRDAQIYVPERRPLLLGAFAVALLFGVNFIGSILPAHDPASNWNRDAALWIGEHTAPEDLVISLEAGEYKHLPPNVTYYAGNAVFGARGLFFEPGREAMLRRQIEAHLAAGRPVYLFGDVLESRLGHIGIARLAGLTEDNVRERIEQMFAGCTRTIAAEHNRHPPLYRLTGCRFVEGVAVP